MLLDTQIKYILSKLHCSIPKMSDYPRYTRDNDVYLEFFCENYVIVYCQKVQSEIKRYRSIVLEILINIRDPLFHPSAIDIIGYISLEHGDNFDQVAAR